MRRGKPTGSQPAAPLQAITGNGTGNIGGIHFHAPVTIGATGKPTPAQFSAGYYDLIEAQKRQTARHLLATYGRPVFVESELIGVWKAWKNQRDWLSLATRRARSVLAALEPGDHNADKLENWCARMQAIHTTYSVLHQELSQLPLVDIKANLVRMYHAEAADGASVNLRDALTSCESLIGQVADPCFMNTLNIAGQFGSGRSRLLVRMAELDAEEERVVIRVGPGQDESVGTAIARQVFEGSAIKVERFEDLSRFLGQTPQRAFTIMVDDLDVWARHNPDVVDELQWLIDESSAVPGLRWVCCADVNNLDAASSDDSFFWRRHGYLPSLTNGELAPALDRTTGWIDLDSANMSQQLSLEILRKAATHGAPELDALAEDPEMFAHELKHLSSPLAVWIRLETYQEHEGPLSPRRDLTDVNSPEFVRAYWVWVKRRLSKGRKNQAADLESLMRELSATYAQRPGESLVVDQEFASKHEDGLAALREGSLITLSKWGDAEVEEPTSRITPNFPALWGLRIARWLGGDGSESLEYRPSSNLTAWWASAVRGSGVAEAVCQFSLVLSPPTQDDESIWSVWSTDRSSPKAPLLLAALMVGTDSAERWAITCASRARYKPGGRREQFILMRFIAGAGSESWSVANRLISLAPHSAAILTNGLEAYLHRALTVLLENDSLITEGNYLRVLHALDGFSGERVNKLAADLMVRAGHRLYSGEDELWLRTILKFCRKAHPRRIEQGARNQERTGPAKGRRMPPPAPRVEWVVEGSFAGALTSAAIGHVISSSGADGTRRLAQLGWWTGEDEGIDQHLAGHMRATLTTAYGSSIHSHGTPQEDLDQYARVIRDLLDGRLLRGHRQSKRIAYFLVKHSVPTHGKSDVEVPFQLRPFLVTLSRDRALITSLGEDAMRLLRRNGITAQAPQSQYHRRPASKRWKR